MKEPVNKAKSRVSAIGIFVGIFLLACSSEPIGSSDDKVRLDVEDTIQTLTNRLVSVSDFKINSRNVLAEDRV